MHVKFKDEGIAHHYLSELCIIAKARLLGLPKDIEIAHNTNDMVFKPAVHLVLFRTDV
jgi:hypothetical protein